MSTEDIRTNAENTELDEEMPESVSGGASGDQFVCQDCGERFQGGVAAGNHRKETGHKILMI